MNIETYLNQFQRTTENPTLETMKWIMQKFQNPQRQYKVIHVAGTNGSSAMEEAFTDEAVRLIEEGVSGGMSKVVDESTGSADDLCVTSYGVHLLFYVGNVDAYDVPITNIDGVYISENDRVGAESSNLYYKVINPLTGETYFDMLFDEVYPASSDEENYTSNTGYTDYEQSIITNYKNVVQVTKNTSKIEGTRI